MIHGTAHQAALFPGNHLPGVRAGQRIFAVRRGIFRRVNADKQRPRQVGFIGLEAWSRRRYA